MTINNTMLSIDEQLVNNYHRNLVNLFYKILPMRENGEESLPVYLENLKCELIGCKKLMERTDCDPYYMSLICILQYLLETPDCEVSSTKRQVFKAISICNKLGTMYWKEGDVE